MNKMRIYISNKLNILHVGELKENHARYITVKLLSDKDRILKASRKKEFSCTRSPQ